MSGTEKMIESESLSLRLVSVWSSQLATHFPLVLVLVLACTVCIHVHASI